MRLWCFIYLIFISENISSQDLDPRAYARVPVDMTYFVAGFVYSTGSVVSDPTVPIQDLEADVESPMIGAGVSKNLFGLTSQFFAAIPFVWAQATGKVFGTESSISRAGLGDLRLRISVLLHGAPAARLEDFSKEHHPLVIGTSLTVITPTGQAFPDKLINVGTNRWSFKPELGLSYNTGKTWLFDFYAGVWMFTDNNSFYPGTSRRSQDPLFSFQGHISYNFSSLMWAAIDLTYYTGGQSSVNDYYNDDGQNNIRAGATFNFPLSRQSSIRLAYSRGAIVRIGANFSTFSASWQIILF